MILVQQRKQAKIGFETFRSKYIKLCVSSPRPTSGCLFKQAIQGLFTGKMDDLDDEWGKDIHTGWPAPSSISCNSLSMS